MDTENHWQAVLARDARFDGSFVYAVRSTGIYCRPSCPSRRPARGQVTFFPVPELAERSGFRPCRRCRPQRINGASPAMETVRRACRYIDVHPDQRPTLQVLSAQVGVSPHHLHRMFKRVTGITPRQYGDARRVDRVKRTLRERKSVTEALYEAGFGSTRGLYERARSHLGMTPATYRRGGRRMRMEYTIAPCSLGKLLIAATQHGVCAVKLGDSLGALQTELRREFPSAEVARNGTTLREWVHQVIKHLEGRRPHLSLPLDVQATAFQRQVWEALRTIPYGSTRSYSDVARAIGRPKAARAVGHACASNPVAVIVPCHRVVREDGDLGGYRWGRERKKALLAVEREVASKTKRSKRRKAE